MQNQSTFYARSASQDCTGGFHMRPPARAIQIGVILTTALLFIAINVKSQAPSAPVWEYLSVTGSLANGTTITRPFFTVIHKLGDDLFYHHGRVPTGTSNCERRRTFDWRRSLGVGDSTGGRTGRGTR